MTTLKALHVTAKCKSSLVNTSTSHIFGITCRGKHFVESNSAINKQNKLYLSHSMISYLLKFFAFTMIDCKLIELPVSLLRLFLVIVAKWKC